jgi:hypothetical protein
MPLKHLNQAPMALSKNDTAPNPRGEHSTPEMRLTALEKAVLHYRAYRAGLRAAQGKK